MGVRLLHLRPLELGRRPLLDRLHPAPLLHQRRPVLRHRAAAQVHLVHDRQGRVGHAGRGLDGAHTGMKSSLVKLLYLKLKFNVTLLDLQPNY